MNYKPRLVLSHTFMVLIVFHHSLHIFTGFCEADRTPAPPPPLRHELNEESMAQSPKISKVLQFTSKIAKQCNNFWVKAVPEALGVLGHLGKVRLCSCYHKGKIFSKCN